MTGLLDLLTGAVFCALGAVGFRTGRARHRPSGVLMIATGLAWLLGSVWPAATFLHRGPLVHLVIGYPNGRLRGRLPIMGVGLGYLDVIPAIGADQRATFVVGAVTMLATAVGRRRAPAVERQAPAVALIVGSVVMGVLIAGTLVRMATTAANPFVLTAYEAVLLGAAVTLFADGTWGRPDRAALAGLTVDLGNRGGASVAEALATALGDPTLRLGHHRSIDRRAERRVRRRTHLAIGAGGGPDQDGDPGIRSGGGGAGPRGPGVDRSGDP